MQRSMFKDCLVENFHDFESNKNIYYVKYFLIYYFILIIDILPRIREGDGVFEEWSCFLIDGCF